jgi:uncharacterized protein Yka (UPF0111/DUF47 family)
LRALIRSFGPNEFRAATQARNMLVAGQRVFGAFGKRTGINTMFGWFQRLLPQQGNFFEMFEAHATTLVAGADALARLLQGGPGQAGHIREIEEREHDADAITREVLQTVRRTFLTPFDRGANAVDLYEITEVEPEMRDMAASIVDAARLTAEAIPLLRRVADNGHRLHELTERIVRIEGHADEIHAAGLKRVYKQIGKKDPLQFFVRQEMFKRLERVVDRFEDVANEIDGLVIDHS